MVRVIKLDDVRPEVCRPAGIEIMINTLAGPCDAEQADFLDPKVHKTGVLSLDRTGCE